MPPLTADVDPAVITFLVTLTPLLVILTTILQSWYQKRVAATKEEADKKLADKKATEDRKAADEKAAADKKALEDTAKKLAATTQQTAKALAEKVDDVHKAVGPPNGKGVVEKLDAVLERLAAITDRQDAHEKEDQERHDYSNRRYDETIAKILNSRCPPEAQDTPSRQ